MEITTSERGIKWLFCFREEYSYLKGPTKKLLEKIIVPLVDYITLFQAGQLSSPRSIATQVQPGSRAASIFPGGRAVNPVQARL